MKKTRGFTLLELIIVMLIISIGLAIVGVGIHRFLLTPQQLDPVEQIQADLIHARNQASIDDAPVSVRVDFATQELNATTQNGRELVHFQLPENYTFEADTEIQDNSDPKDPKKTTAERIGWTFLPDGTTQNTSFRVRLPDNSIRRIVMRAGSGRVLVINPDEAGS